MLARAAWTIALSASLAAACAPSRPTVRSAQPEPPPPETPPAIEGDVLDPTGSPVAAALVSAWSHFKLDDSDPPHDVTTDANGHFRFASLPAGRWGITATSPGKTAAYAGVLELPPAGARALIAPPSTPRAAPLHVTLHLGPSGPAIEGTVRSETGAPASFARILASPWSEREYEVYVTRTDSQGHYAFTLPGHVDSWVVVDAPPHPRAFSHLAADSHGVDLSLEPPPPPRPSDDAITAWLQTRATPLTAEGDLDASQSRAFEAIAADAPLVAMGEATHGSAEFPDWRRRVFEALVRDKGFTVYAVEVGYADALALDDYVVTGKGDPVAAIHGLTTWKDETTETLALVQWMRAYNADPKHPKKVHFEGFDVYTPGAVPRIVAYLAKVDPAAKDDARATLAPFADVGCDSTYPALPAEMRAHAKESVDALLARFDAKHVAYAARSSEEDWARVRQLVRIVQQAEVSYRDYAARDAQMVENIDWLLRHQAPSPRLLLDAHNGHISAAGFADILDMGRRLRKEWGSGYVTIGFAYGEGSFLAFDASPNRKSFDRIPFTVGRAPRDTFDGALAMAKLLAFVVDLRTADPPIEAWLKSSQRMHSVGGDFNGVDAFAHIAPARAFDAILYVDHVTAIHPLPPAK
ncbi:MAG: erythromycin esterase family protein [Polyangiaceae bacterium]